ncbi:BTB/POZ protein [Whalleya microplaca]|nr:BTB/POZ protein [Whalleya microplaca]
MRGQAQNNTFSEDDEQLLTSGLFADVKVICGDQTWNLHRNIICSRCDYFKKAFTSQFMEATTKEITIREQDPTKVNWVITFIYTRKASPDLEALLDDHETFINTCTEVLTISDFFCLDSFQILIASELERDLSESRANSPWLSTTSLLIAIIVEQIPNFTLRLGSAQTALSPRELKDFVVGVAGHEALEPEDFE